MGEMGENSPQIDISNKMKMENYIKARQNLRRSRHGLNI